MFGNCGRYIFCSIVVMGVALGAAADTKNLKEIMQGLRNDTFQIADGLLIGDFEMIVEGAGRIANHAQIPAEQVQLVAAELGAEMASFKNFDTLVHDLSLSIAAAARNGDTSLVASNYHRLLDGCLACHSAYRERVANVLADANVAMR